MSPPLLVLQDLSSSYPFTFPVSMGPAQISRLGTSRLYRLAAWVFFYIES